MSHLEKMKAYIISLIAFSDITDAGDTGLGTYVEHIPALVPAVSAKAAADSARAQALNKWPISEGWHGHQAAIMPVPKAFYEAAVKAMQAGIVDVDDESEQGAIFQFEK